VLTINPDTSIVENLVTFPRFEDLKIDCNDQLHIYDGAHAIGNPKVKPGRIGIEYDYMHGGRLWLNQVGLICVGYDRVR